MVPLYDNEDSVCGIAYNGAPYYFLKNLQGDIIAITNSFGDTVARYSYDAWGVCSIAQDSSNCQIATINPYRYRGYYFDEDIQLYYLQSRYYDPTVGRFVNGDEQFCSRFIGTNLFCYTENSPIIGVDADGKRTYFINGINNTSSCGVPSYAKKFKKKLTKLGIKDVRNIGVYKGNKKGFKRTVKDVAKVILEMFNINVYTDMVVKIINEDLAAQKLGAKEQLNIIAYSGGGQIAMNVMVKLKNKLNNVVLIGTPILKSWKLTTKVSMIYAGWDPLSWNVGWGFKSYFAGWIGHTSYFSDKNIDNVANIVNKIIN